jgi:hypothetical protein
MQSLQSSIFRPTRKPPIENLPRRHHPPIFKFSPSFQKPFRFSPLLPSIFQTFTSGHVKRDVVELTLAVAVGVLPGAAKGDPG